MSGRRVRRILWTLAICILGVLGLRTLVGDLFQVSSSSMEPFLWPGEVILVTYDHSPPRRMELVVFKRRGEYVIKRVAGLGGEAGEDVRIDSNGDLQIDGHYLAADLPRPRILLFDQEQQDIERYFAHGSSRGDPWRKEGDVLELDARQVKPGQAGGLLRYHPRLLDNYLDQAGGIVEGQETVADAAVACEVRFLERGGLFRIGLKEGGDTFWLRVDLTQQDSRLELLRASKEGMETLAEVQIEVELESWIPVSFENIDNHLSARFGATRLGFSYDFNHPAESSLGERIKLGGEACRLELRRLRVWRDLHYTARGHYAVGGRYPLEAGKLFVLGDNSANSMDSREYGAIDADQVIGRPRLVVWPPSAIRWLN